MTAAVPQVKRKRREREMRESFANDRLAKVRLTGHARSYASLSSLRKRISVTLFILSKTRSSNASPE